MMRELLPAIIAFALTFGIFWAASRLMPKLPAKWFCDYDETPDAPAIRQKLHNKIAVTAVLSGVTGLMSAACVFTRGLNAQSGLSCLIFVILMLIAVTDIKFTIIPDQFVLAVFVLSLPGYVLNGLAQKNWQGWVFPLLGALLGGVFIFLLNAVGRLIYQNDAFGMGDLKLLLVCGFLCSLKLTVAVLFLSIVAGGIHFSLLALTKKTQRQEQRPFGPYIAAAVAAVLAFTPQLQQLWTWYTGLLKR